MENKKIEEELLKLLEQYHHYCCMTSIKWYFSWYAGMSLGGFMQWLKSRK